jgi:Protein CHLORORESPIRATORY REDUCTION 7
MPDSLMYQSEETFVVLETNQPEYFLSAPELFEKLKAVVAQIQDNLPPDLQRFPTLEAQTRHLMDTSCDFNIDSDHYLQWYVVRLEK